MSLGPRAVSMSLEDDWLSGDLGRGKKKGGCWRCEQEQGFNGLTSTSLPCPCLRRVTLTESLGSCGTRMEDTGRTVNLRARLEQMSWKLPSSGHLEDVWREGGSIGWPDRQRSIWSAVTFFPTEHVCHPEQRRPAQRYTAQTHRTSPARIHCDGPAGEHGQLQDGTQTSPKKVSQRYDTASWVRLLVSVTFPLGTQTLPYTNKKLGEFRKMS